MITTETENDKCPTCESDINAAAGNGVPSPGDMTICAYCESLLIFGEGLILRHTTKQEEQELLELEEVQLALAIVRKIRKQMEH